MQGCIRLTILPESSTVGNGRPLILSSAPGAPTDRSQCTIQPANHVRPGGVRWHGLVPRWGSRRLLYWSPGALWCALLWETAVLAPQHPGIGQHPPAPQPRRVQQQWAKFHIPTAWRWVLRRARRSRSMTTRSATRAAVGSPSKSQC